MMKNIVPTLLCIILLIAGLSSCKNAPAPCFLVLTPADSIRVGHVVKFDASCSSDVTVYYWDFGNGLDTNSTVAQTTYTTVATYSVTLVVGNAGKSASVTKSIVVLP